MKTSVVLPLVVFLSGFSTSAADDRTREYIELRRLIGQERFDEAFEKCKGLIERYPDHSGPYCSLAEISLYRRSFDPAMAFLNSRLSWGERMDQVLFGLGMLCYQRGEYKIAIRYVLRAIDPKSSSTEAFWVLAKSYEKMAGVDDALQIITRLCSRNPETGGYWYAVCLLHWSKSNFDAAKRALRNACEVDPFEPTYADLLAAVEYVQLRSPQSSLRLRDRIRSAEVRVDLDQAFLLRSILIHGEATHSPYDSLKTLLQSEIAQSRELGFFHWAALFQLLYASQTAYHGDFEESLVHISEVCKYADFANDTRTLNNALDLKTTSLIELSRLDEALESSFSWLETVDAGNRIEDVVRALCGISGIYHEKGDDARALDYAIEARSKAEAFLVDMGIYSDCESALALAQYGIGHYKSALNHFRAGIRAIPKDSYWGISASVYHGNIGNCLMRLGDVDGAGVNFRRQLDIARKLEFAREEAYAMSNLGEYKLTRGEVDTARILFQSAFEWSRRRGNKTLQVESLRGLARTACIQGRGEDALQFLRTAIDLSISNGAVFGSKLAALVDDCRKVSGLLVQEKRLVDALNYAEVSKLLNLKGSIELVQNRASNSTSPIELEIPTQRGSLTLGGRTMKANKGTSRGGRREHASVLTPIRIRHDWNWFRDQLRNGLDLEILREGVLSSGKINDSNVEPGYRDRRTTVIEFVVHENTTDAFVLTSDTLTCLTISLGKVGLRELLGQLSRFTDLNHAQSSILFGGMVEFNRTTSYSLFKALVQPLSESLRFSSNLIIVPDDCLSGLPFECLQLEDDFSQQRLPLGPSSLIEYFDVSYLPAVMCGSSIEVWRPRGSVDGVLVVSLSSTLDEANIDYLGHAVGRMVGGGKMVRTAPLPHLYQEASAITGILKKKSRLILGSQVTNRDLLRGFEDFQILHIAGHSFHDDADLSTYGISCFAADGSRSNLGVAEIVASDIRSELVTLSGCNTARGTARTPSLGLAQIVYLSGASSSIGSLWPVEDESTAQLMTRFYTYLEGNETRASALRKAKIDLIRCGRGDPYYWAGFILIGSSGSIRFHEPEATFGVISILAVISIFGLTVISWYGWRRWGEIDRWTIK